MNSTLISWRCWCGANQQRVRKKSAVKKRSSHSSFDSNWLEWFLLLWINLNIQSNHNHHRSISVVLSLFSSHEFLIERNFEIGGLVFIWWRTWSPSGKSQMHACSCFRPNQWISMKSWWTDMRFSTLVSIWIRWSMRWASSGWR